MHRIGHSTVAPGGPEVAAVIVKWTRVNVQHYTTVTATGRRRHGPRLRSLPAAWS
jgi:hypothetical protein